MSSQNWTLTGALKGWIAGLPVVILLFMMAGGGPTIAQETKQAGQIASPNATSIARGKYIVQGVAACGECHTPRKANGDLDYSRWLGGASVPYLSARYDSNWPIMAPRIGGLPPANDAQMITLLTTGIWVDGKPLRSPMPRFHMTREDAEAVLSYLKSVNPRQTEAP